MKIGIVAEGRSDIGVITNIIRGITGLDKANILPIRPSFKYDKTDKARLAHLDPATHGSWTNVRQDCIERKNFDLFFSRQDNDLMVIHLDSAQAADYPVDVPSKNSKEDCKEYCTNLRRQIIIKIQEWLENKYADSICYAIAIKEIDSWLLTIYDYKSCEVEDPKKELRKKLRRYSEGYDAYLEYSDDFSYPRKVKREGYLERNCSLQLFWEELEKKYGKIIEPSLKASHAILSVPKNTQILNNS